MPKAAELLTWVSIQCNEGWMPRQRKRKSVHHTPPAILSVPMRPVVVTSFTELSNHDYFCSYYCDDEDRNIRDTKVSLYESHGADAFLRS